MAAVLKTFLADAGRRGFTWGTYDCAVFGGEWARALCGQDPIARFRGRYASEQEARDLIAAEGGAEAVIGQELVACGWARAETQSAGDIVLAIVPGHTDPVIAVAVDARRMAFVTKRGILCWPGTAVAIWHWSGARG